MQDIDIREFIANKSERLDVFLAKKLGNSRSQVATLIKNDFVSVNLTPAKASLVLKNDDKIKVQLPKVEKKSAKFTPNFDAAVLFEDDDVLVLSKPPNVVVHSAASVKEATLVDWLLAKNYALSSISGQSRAGLVHRLDKGTSGAIIIAKNNAVHETLSKALSQRTLGRFYLAIVDLPLKENAVCVEKSIVRCPKNRLKKMALNDDFTGASRVLKNTDVFKGTTKGARAAKSLFVNVLCESDSKEVLDEKVLKNGDFRGEFKFLDEKSVNFLDKNIKNSQKNCEKIAKDSQKNHAKNDKNSQFLVKNLAQNLIQNQGENLKNLTENQSENLPKNQSEILVKNECEKIHKIYQENSQNSQNVAFYGFSRDEVAEFLSLCEINFCTQKTQENTHKNLKNSQFSQKIHAFLNKNPQKIHAQNEIALLQSQNPQENSQKIHKANAQNYTKNSPKNSQNPSQNPKTPQQTKPQNPKIPTKNINLIAAKLFTGRTHQIRTHLESLNRHILGDTLYGYKGVAAPRVMLHSYILYFEHPIKKQNIFVKAPIYTDFEAILRQKFTQKEIDEATSLSAIMRYFTRF